MFESGLTNLLVYREMVDCFYCYVFVSPAAAYYSVPGIS